jgi:rRNA maturation protein Rpf1
VFEFHAGAEWHVFEVRDLRVDDGVQLIIRLESSMPIYEDTDFEKAARSLRRLLGLEFDPRPDMITVIFKLKNQGLIKNYRRVPPGVADFLRDQKRKGFRVTSVDLEAKK